MKNRLEFIGIEVSYPPPEVCCYPDFYAKQHKLGDLLDIYYGKDESIEEAD